MKPAAVIISIVWALVLVQPSFALFGGVPAYGKCEERLKVGTATAGSEGRRSSCAEKQDRSEGCSKNKCDKPENPSKNDCSSRSCNPSLGCSLGNFFIHHHHSIFLPEWFAQKQRMFLKNDNRISSKLSECWHPPEA